jgi:hypothetical protein
MTSLPLPFPRILQPARPRFRLPFARWMANLTARAGHLLSRSGSLLSDANGCSCCPDSGGACPCPDLSEPCSFCSDAVPTQFHVTFTGIALCAGCIDCSATGTSLQLSGSINGTYLMPANGECGWATFASDVPLSATFFTGPGCSGTSVPAQFSIAQTRISATQFRLQIADSTNTVFIFRATITTARCCTSYTATNDLATCGCTNPTGIITAGTGGLATVTRC